MKPWSGRLLVVCSVVALGACARPSSGSRCARGEGAASAQAGARRGAAERAEIELVETAPVEATLDHADLREAAEVWPELIDRARRTLDVAAFYASEADGAAARTSRLAPVLASIERAVARGVRVRLLADAVFAPKYPDTLARLRRAGVAVKILDCAPRYGGVQHAKYMVMDGEEAFVGSQNLDWRSLAHIQEMGVRVRSATLTGALADVFETDWALADASVPNGVRSRLHARGSGAVTARSGEALTVWASPRGWLPDEARWDLDGLVRLLDGAARAIDVQVLTYSTTNRDGSAFTTLDEALRRAAARGVRVRLLVSHWAAKPGHARASLDALATVPNVTVRVLTVPPASSGEIPFARVAHAKYMVVDGRAAWIGTSNWEGDYFLKTRNVAVVAEGGALAPRLERVFEDGWTSAYTATLVR